jgi:hypothetical protein
LGLKHAFSLTEKKTKQRENRGDFAKTRPPLKVDCCMSSEIHTCLDFAGIGDLSKGIDLFIIYTVSANRF